MAKLTKEEIDHVLLKCLEEGNLPIREVLLSILRQLLAAMGVVETAEELINPSKFRDSEIHSRRTLRDALKRYDELSGGTPLEEDNHG